MSAARHRGPGAARAWRVRPHARATARAAARAPRTSQARTAARGQQRGQAMVEYALIAAVMVTALLVVDTGSGKSMAQALADGVRGFFRALTFYLSLP